MASIRSPSLFTPLLPLRRCSKFFAFFPKLQLCNSRNSILILSCSSPGTIPTTEQEVLQAIADSDDKSLPCVRTYENDSALLTLIGAVDFQQALTAAAADGGEAASEHVSSGMPAMVVETVLPGPSDDHSTVSTRLFLPARKVLEKATKLRRSLSEDIFSSITSRNILALTFRQVVLQQLWNFDMIVFKPGAERDMEDLENPREVLASFSLSSSDEHLISTLAEVVCTSVLQGTQRQFVDNLQGGNLSRFFPWFEKSERIVSKDSSVILYKLFEEEIVENARSLLDYYNSMKSKTTLKKIKPRQQWWKPSCYEKLQKIGGSDFSAWTSEYVPAYRLEINANRMGDTKFEGWKKSAENRWEVLLTHSQMVGLAETLDMYYEDPYSLPDKQLPCGVAAKFAKVSNKKGSSYLWKIFSVTLASGIFLVAISALGQLCLPHLCKGGRSPGEHRSLPSSEVHSAIQEFSDATKLEEFCILAVAKLKDALGWPEDIKMEHDIGVWIGELPGFLRTLGEANSDSEGVSTLSTSQTIDEEIKISLQDIASYQVVFSSDGKIIGFQPLSRVAVNQWAVNPLAKELYGGKKLSPGIIEPGLRASRPSEVIVVELLMSVKPDGYFALARPFH
ncbi:hypothetical protein L6164_036756 [Bauhinia variegata]|uniref:Uncharacterized protein n=1 Tax=Bauhinia variegata TaxID=167791 RepID=A0ACB9KI35_BAUVA|nr:hypothetical protein L6164_036756 [Bauhinia variegata]